MNTMNTMNTRSQTNAIILGCLNKINNNSSSKKEMKREKEKEKGKPLFSVDINFAEASSEWHLNKKRIGHEYIYICLETCKTDKSGKNKVCGKKCYHYNSTCFIHRNRNK